MKNLQPRTKKIILVLSGLAFAIIVVVLALVNIFSGNGQKGIDITNFEQYVTNLTENERINIERALYNVVALNNVTTDGAFMDKATIRESSYEQDFNEDVYTTSFIVDMPTLKQSYKISNLYSSIVELTSYQTVATCLSEDKLIFGEFDCVDAIIIEKGGVGGDIMSILPIVVPHYTIKMGAYNGGRLTPIDVTIRIWTSETSKEESDSVVDYYKQEINDWIVMSGFKLENYKFNYSVRFFE